MPRPVRPVSPRQRLATVLPQAGLLLALGLLMAWLASNTVRNLASRGITVGFDFLERAARFPISESLLAYTPSDSFAWAIVVGLGNTLFLAFIIAGLSTLLGLPVGLARRSRQPLAFGLSSLFVDICRNTPLVVLLLFCYAIVIFGLPPSASAANPLTGVYLTDRGLYLPRLVFDGPVWAAAAALTIGIAGAVLASRKAARQLALALFMLGAAAALAVWWLAGVSASVGYPTLGRFNFEGGTTLTPELVAIVVGLTLYSTAFTAEIIRGGIDAVPRGQWEAGRAGGLSERQVLRFIVLPQALRVIIPPMTSQYINIIKNSTLALVVGYPDINFVIATTINQTGQAIEGILILMAVFLTISLGASWLMNRFNRRVALVER